MRASKTNGGRFLFSRQQMARTFGRPFFSPPNKDVLARKIPKTTANATGPPTTTALLVFTATAMDKNYVHGKKTLLKTRSNRIPAAAVGGHRAGSFLRGPAFNAVYFWKFRCKNIKKIISGDSSDEDPLRHAFSDQMGTRLASYKYGKLCAR